MAQIKAIDPAPRTERQNDLIETAAELAGDQTDKAKLIGYTVLCFYDDGTTRGATWRPNPEEHRMGSQMFEAWARASLNAHLAYGNSVNATYDVLNGAI